MTTKQNILATIGLLVIIALIGLAGNMETHYYRRDCKVVEVNDDRVSVVDKCGYEWVYYVEEDVPAVGTKVDLKMFTSYTDSTIGDDEIVKVIEKE